MGCDIHYVVERNVNGRWVGLFGSSPRTEDAIAKNRNYTVFGELAGVRRRSPTGHSPRGVPAPSELAALRIEEWGEDGHSHSWLTMREFCDAYLRAAPECFKDAWHRARPWGVLFGMYCEKDEGDDPNDFRVVFWFDN